MNRIDVVSGIIARDGRLLLTQRDRRSDFGWLWESPGGKVEPREMPRGALQRELAEELGINATIGDPVQSFDFDPPLVHVALRVTFYLVTKFTGEPRPLAAIGIGWFSPTETLSLELAPANAALFKQDNKPIMREASSNDLVRWASELIAKSRLHNLITLPRRDDLPFRYTGQPRHELKDK